MSVCTTVVSTRSFWPSSSPSSTAACTTRSLIALRVSGVSRVNPRWNAIVSRHRQAIEVCELAQSVSIGNPLTQFAIVQVLDAPQNQRAQDLLRRQTGAPRLGVLQTARQIAADLLDDILLVVKKIGKGLQQRIKPQTLTRQLPIGKTDLLLRCPRHRSAPIALLRFGALSLQRLGISRCSLLKQMLKSTPVVQAELNLRHKRFRHIDGNTTPLRAAVQDITLMLVTRQTCRAILPDAATPPQAQRAKHRRPKISHFDL